MSSYSLLLEAMRTVIREAGLKEVPAAGEFRLPHASPTIFPGAVYGFAVPLSLAERRLVFDEAASRDLNSIRSLESFIPIQADLCPLYWGKDKQLGARPHQHLQDPMKTGAIRLSTYSSLAGKVIACVSLTVDRSALAEIALQQRFPHLLKTTTKKQSP